MKRITRSTWLTFAVCAVVLGAVLVGGLAIGGAFDDDDRTIMPIELRTQTSGASPPRPDIVVDDRIDDGDARKAASAAENRFGGVALSVDRDDGRYEIELQRPDGSIVEVLVDDQFRVLGIDATD